MYLRIFLSLLATLAFLATPLLVFAQNDDEKPAASTRTDGELEDIDDTASGQMKKKEDPKKEKEKKDSKKKKKQKKSDDE
jgi:hypothetical protein